MESSRLASLAVSILPAIVSAASYAADTTKSQTGYFIDAPVTGLFYTTSSNLTGFTDKGAFQYHPGDVVSFFLGKDEKGFLLTQLSGQQVVTPTLSSTSPSKSINLTRLLLSLDSTPKNREEILLLSDMLADPKFQQQLRQLDLNILDSVKGSIDIDWVSAQDAVEHLNQSQQYIEENFTSEQVVFSPLNKRLSNIMIKKKDPQGKVCLVDLRYIDRPNYNTPIGEIKYQITPKQMLQYPSSGDYFRNCYLDRSKALKTEVEEPISNFVDSQGLVACSMRGCTRNDLNGFAVEDFDDEGDWKYRTMAINFDPTTELLMEKVQGLGPKEQVRHANQGEMIWFTYPEQLGHQIPFEGIWQQTTYIDTDIQQSCLKLENDRVWQGPVEEENCPSESTAYTQDVTDEFGDMWWLSNSSRTAELAQMNVMVRWYPAGMPPRYTTWEYLPAGREWDQGILYRYQQNITRNRDGSDQIQTYAISEFKKVSGEI